MDAAKVMKYLILSIRAASEAALSMLDEESGEQGPPEPTASSDPAVCEHPPDQRVRIGTMGSEDSWICGVCGYCFEGVSNNE